MAFEDKWVAAVQECEAGSIALAKFDVHVSEQHVSCTNLQVQFVGRHAWWVQFVKQFIREHVWMFIAVHRSVNGVSED